MTYKETLTYLYSQLPMFQRIGGTAYKAGLETSKRLSALFNHPEQSYLTIHVAGTNGKGSVSHLLAAILQQSGYRVGLYTSPHLVDFRERIRVNGEMIPEKEVTGFVQKYIDSGFDGSPSFFELTMTMAFDYFRKAEVDIAVIEVGLGGRLDSTNIINPLISIITNISFDHTQFLGDTLEKIAFEKAGIIKKDIPVVVGEAEGNIKEVFINKAKETNSPIIFAEDNSEIISCSRSDDRWLLTTRHYGTITDELSGECQVKNANTVFNALTQLKKKGIKITDNAVETGFYKVCELTGLQGRWMILSDSPRTICDTGHNVGGMQYITRQLKSERYSKLHIVIGFVNDKDISSILKMLPKDAAYYFTQASIPRALDCGELKGLATSAGLKGECYDTVVRAYNAAIKKCSPGDLLFIGGSTFVVADLISFINGQQ